MAISARPPAHAAAPENLADAAPADEELDEAGLEDGADGAGAQPLLSVRLGPEDGGERLDKALARHFPQYSRSRIQQWMEAGHVLVDGKPARPKDAAIGEELVEVAPQSVPEDTAYRPEDIPLSVVHQDESLLVIDKPAGLVVHPAAGNWSGTLLNGLLHRFPALANVPRAGIVHRLDKDTSGLMVVARTLEAHTDLVRQLQARSVHREYLALVWGRPRPNGSVEAPIGRHPRERLKMAVVQGENDKPALTRYRRLADGKLDGREVSLVECRLETGRTHQIRVHMQSLGFPLVGDGLYGKSHLAGAFPRQALHARRLGLVHPDTGQACEWLSPLPGDFAQLLERAGVRLPDS